MPLTCCVVGCGSRGNRDKVSFYRIPTNTDKRGRENEVKARRREAWLNAIGRGSDLQGTKLKYARICSKHFIKGAPAEDDSETHPDWIPTKNLKPSKKRSPGKPSPSVAKRKRYCRVKDRNRRSLLESFTKAEVTIREGTSSDHITVQEAEVTANVLEIEEVGDSNEKLKQEIKILKQDLEDRLIEIANLKKINSNLELSFDTFKDNDKKTLFFTGLPTFFVFDEVFQLLEPHLISNQPTALSPFQQILLTFMKLRLNLSFTYLAYRFNISQTTASRYFYKCINLMYYKLKRFVRWPDRDELRCKMPDSFKKHFGDRVSVILDCFEISIERASSMEAKLQTWSQYKHNYTIKYLIGISPQGFISYISKGYGGRSSDTHITDDCGILNNLLPGDVILADRGFRIEDSVRIYMAEVQTPAFVKGKKQLSPTDVENTRTLANVRIHVERVIGSLRQKYTILSNKLPITILSKYSNETVTTIDKIVVICCALTNLCPGIVALKE